MKIEFSAGASGFHEAHELKKAVRHLVNTVHHGESSDILAAFEAAADEHMERPEFADLRDQACFDDRVEASQQSALRTWWESIMGPSLREQELARQRMEALNRATHAEAVSFDAVAEAARLEKELAALQQQLAACRDAAAE